MRRGPTSRRGAGFTLVELVVALVILGVILGIAGPAFVWRGAAASDADEAPVVRLLGRARRTAVESARVTTVIVDPQAARAWVRSDGPGPGVDTVIALDLARGVVLSSDAARPRFVFDPRGAATGDLLTVASPTGRSTIVVDRASGDVRVATAPGADRRAP